MSLNVTEKWFCNLKKGGFIVSHLFFWVCRTTFLQPEKNPIMQNHFSTPLRITSKGTDEKADCIVMVHNLWEPPSNVATFSQRQTSSWNKTGMICT